MRAIILAAGRGSRMGELTEDRPKCLVELHGKPLLDWQLDALHEAGVSEIAVVTGYKRELIAHRGLAEFYNPRWAETNMVSSLTCAAAWLEAVPCIVSYSDIFYGAGAVRAVINGLSPITITYDANWRMLWQKRFGDPLVDAETFRINADGTLAEIGRRPKTLEEVEGQYMGLLRFTPNGWNEVIRVRSALSDEECDQMQMTGLLQKVIEAEQISVAAVPYYGKWGEVDSADDLAVYR